MEQLSLDDNAEWPVPPTRQNSVFIDALPSPIWTETKAKLIANYLKYFLFITHHGVYIDGFAGPQDANNLESWAAKLVVEMEPKWLNNFFLCELNSTRYRLLEDLVKAQTPIPRRTLVAQQGDINQWIDEVLRSDAVTDSKATFALLDQHSCECHWRTVEELARFKKGQHKIELFYFFPTGWVHRAIEAFKDPEPLDAWWGDNTWSKIPGLKANAAATLMTDRIRQLGYADVKAWPIFQREDGGRTMYHMIHATDHLEAPKLMYRAYRKLVANSLEQQQMDLWEQRHLASK